MGGEGNDSGAGVSGAQVPHRFQQGLVADVDPIEEAQGVDVVIHGSCSFFRDKTLSWERVDRAKPGTGVGRDMVGPGAAPLPALWGHLPPGEGRG